MSINKKKIADLIVEDNIHASVVFHFGMCFYSYSENKFEEACEHAGVDPITFVNDLELVNQKNEEHNLFLMSYPIHLILDYLKRNYFVCIKKKLPFLMQLMRNAHNDTDAELIKDLQFSTSIFIEDFICHAYYEESIFFKHIRYLQKANSEGYKPGELFYQLEKNIIHKFAAEHELVSNKMIGVRNIMDGYRIHEKTSQPIKSIFNSLRSLEKELDLYATIKNETLFPKALTLEKKMRKKFRETIALN